MFKRVLIANRGEIACRITRTLHAMGLEAVAVYSDADEHALHVRTADAAVRLGPGPVAESYLCADKLIEAALQARAQAIHPGYGFLSENAVFAAACEDAGLVFLGPTPDQLRSFGRKHEARALAEASGVPLAPGSGLITDPDEAHREAERIGYPLLIKSTAGGGGIGMTVCRKPDQLEEALASSRRLAASHFGEAGVFLERYVEAARHVEVQIFGDGEGGVVTFGTRDCSVQRRNQKVIEETPAPNLSEQVRNDLRECARALASAAKYRSAGTVEFLVDAISGAFYFLEMNTRLQVEHGVTEAVFGVDLVEWMIQLGTGELPPLDQGALTENGHAIQTRLYAEDPRRNYQPSTGTLTHLVWPEGVRCDTGVERGDEISPFYDPMVAKLIVHGKDRVHALSR